MCKTIKELKKLVLTSKKEDIETSKAYAAILKQVESATIGVKNAEKDEAKLIVSAAKKELKEQIQSKAFDAPFSERTIEICDKIISTLVENVLTEEETENAVKHIMEELSEPERKIGNIMNIMKTKYGNDLDMKFLSEFVKKILN